MLDGLKIANNDIEIIAETVVVRRKKKSKGVAIVSGGGSGHEPAHAGYVAQGMLDAQFAEKYLLHQLLIKC